jgi:hypothetical protein
MFARVGPSARLFRGKLRAVITSCYRGADGKLRLDLTVDEIR